MNRILYVNHRNEQCGVYQFGLSIGRAIQKSRQQSFIYAECETAAELHDLIHRHSPALIIYNYHPSTMRWLKRRVTQNVPLPQVGTIHEVDQFAADLAHNYLFDFHIAPDPTLLLRNPIVFKTGRLIPQYQNKFPMPAAPIIGSFGFGTKAKGFERLVETVQQEFDAAEIRLNIPFATFGDPDGANALAIARRCHALVTKEGVRLSVTHDFLSQAGLLDFLGQNSVNAFLYDEQPFGRGISSAIDFALAAGRPIAVSDNKMFRHLLSANRCVCIDDCSLSEIIESGTRTLDPFYAEWDERHTIWEYDRIVGKVLLHRVKALQTRLSIPAIIARKIRRKLKREQSAFSWLGTSGVSREVGSVGQGTQYTPAKLADGRSLNRILDNEARAEYAGVIRQMYEVAPDTMAKKIPEANVQQAFVLDTVMRFTRGLENPKILCVGSHEDTAAIGLKKFGLRLEEIDPVLNYELGEYFTKPTTIHGTYDLVFSTSVIEHVEDDETFVRQIATLLKPGGKAVLTCDYLDTYTHGDPKPAVDYRFYTQKDFRERLLPQLSDCMLVDQPQWDCAEPDFVYEAYRYTFATLVFARC